MAEASIGEMKACRKCGLEKPATIDYFSEYGPKNFLRGACRMCRGLKSEGANRRVIRKNLTDTERREAQRLGLQAYYKANREKLLQGRKEARKLDPDFHRQRDAQYYRKNNDKKKARAREYGKANKEKRTVAHREWSAQNRDKISEYGKAHRAKYKEKIYARQQIWIAKNKDHVRTLSRKNYHANNDKMREYHRDYYAENRDHCCNLAKAYRERHKEKLKIYGHKRRKANGSGICFNGDDVKRIYNEQGGVCRYCECDISEYYEVDHFIPIRWGGGHEPENIVLACRFCNRSKGAKLPWVWRPELFT